MYDFMPTRRALMLGMLAIPVAGAPMHPGSTMVITNSPATAANRTGPGFTIITHDDA
jgi:hypothetical protein